MMMHSNSVLSPSGTPFRGCNSADLSFVFPLASHFEVLDVWVIADFVSDR